VRWNKRILQAPTLADVERLLRDMEHAKVERTLVTYNIHLNRCVAAGDLNQGLEILRELKTKADQRFKPDIYTYNTLIHGLAKQQRFDEALALVSEMQDSGVAPDVYTYNSIIGPLAAALKFDLAYELITKMRAAGIRGDLLSYMPVLSGLVRRGTTASNGSNGSNGSNNVDMNRVNEILGFMNDDSVLDSQAYSTVFVELAKLERIDDLKSLLRDMRSRNYSLTPIGLTLVLRALLQAKLTSFAIELIESSLLNDDKAALDAVAYHSIMRFLFESKEFALAERVLERARELGTSSEDYAKLLAMAIETLRHTGERARAYELYVRLPTETPKLSSTFLSALRSSNTIQQAQRVWNDMEAAMVPPTGAHYYIMLSLCCRLQLVDQAFEMARTSLESDTPIYSNAIYERLQQTFPERYQEFETQYAERLQFVRSQPPPRTITDSVYLRRDKSFARPMPVNNKIRKHK